ncbi:MAG: hypothetical protein RMK40_00540 [Chloroflexota bacterium]|nr:hypothetical protein [Chloroflexota bacterium]
MEHWEGCISPTPPFSLALTAGYQTAFQGQVGADTFQNGVFSRLLVRHTRPLLVRITTLSHPEDPDHPSLGIQVVGPTLSPQDTAWAMERAEWILNTSADLKPFYAHIRSDPVLGPALGLLYGLHPPRMPSLFESLVFAICGQQVSAGVARHIRTRLVEQFGESLEWNGQVRRAFPSPERILKAGRGGLRSVGLSERKVEYILECARQAVEGLLPLEDMGLGHPQQMRERLLRLRGVGQWTVEWVFLRGLGHPGVFPAGDLALQRLLARLYTGGAPLDAEGAQALAQRWGPWKGYAAVLLFAGARLGIWETLSRRSAPSVPV